MFHGLTLIIALLIYIHTKGKFIVFQTLSVKIVESLTQKTINSIVISDLL